MNLRQLALAVTDETGLTLADTEETLWAAFDAVARGLAAGDTLTVSNFGTFETYTRRACELRNIATGEPTPVPATRTARFRPTGRLRDMVRTGDTTDSIRKLPQGSAR